MKSDPKSSRLLQTYLDSQKKRVNKQLLKTLKSIQPKKIPPNGFKASTIHSVLLGGKRIRPILAIAVHDACGGNSPYIDSAACSVELIHAGSLILDDLPCMDNAELRRGEPTTHKLFGEATTILASAALWSAAFEIISYVESPQLATLVRRMSLTMGGRGLVQGQLLDLSAFNQTQSIKELQECYRLKTGVLFSLATTLGAALAQAPLDTQAAFDSFGEQLGIGFQIRDDILDATQTAEQTGKDTNLDSINNKPTYVSILGVEGARNALDTTLNKCVKLLAPHAGKDNILYALVDSLRLEQA